MSSINDLINFEYHVAPSRHTGERDEQYKERLRAYSLGMEVGMKQRQAEIDELQKRIDEAWMWCEKGCVLKAMEILKGGQTK